MTPATSAPRPHETRSPSTRAISTYWLDVITVGGASVVFFTALLFMPVESAFYFGATTLPVLNVIFNFPHFMASYRMLYGSRERILRYKTASLWVPLVLLAWGVYGLWRAEDDGTAVHLMIVTTAVYIAWHYTGQAWGMMAAFAGLEGAPFNALERRLVRGGLAMLIALHASIALVTASQAPAEWMPALELFARIAALLSPLSILLGGAGLLLHARRTGKRTPLRVALPWLSVHLWYVALVQGHVMAAFWMQIAHSIQYLAFPARVELNGRARSAQARRLPLALHVVVYAVGLAAAGYFVFNILSGWLNAGLMFMGSGNEPLRLMPLVVSAFINIHHFYVDGCIWKLKDADVRQDLFHHLHHK